MHLALLVVLLVGAVQADPPTSPRAFWLTRPLSRGQVFGAKVLFALGAVVLPVLIANGVTLAGRGFTLGDGAAGVLLDLRVHVVLVFVLLGIGALTTRFPYAVLALVGLVALVAGLSFALIELRPLLASPLGPGQGAEFAATLVTLVVASGTLACSYRRQPVAAARVTVMGAVLAVVVMHLWPFGAPLASRPLPATVQLRVVDVSRTGTAEVWSSGRSVRWGLAGALDVTGTSADVLARAWRVNTLVRWGDNRHEAAGIGLYWVDTTLPTAGERMGIEGLGPVSHLSLPPVAWAAGVSRTTWTEELAGGGAGSAVAHARLQLVRNRLLLRLPVRVGERWRSGSERIELLRVTTEETPRVLVHETGPRLRTPTREWTPRNEGTRRYYAFFNPASHELMSVRWLGGWNPRNIPPVAGGLQIEDFDLELVWPNNERWRERSARAEWLRGAELVKIEETVVAEGDRTVELPQLRLPEMPPGLR